MRNKLILAAMLLCAAIPVQVSIGSPNVRISINLPMYPQLVRVPDYPVYYASDLDANYFFYDGLYWVYQDDYWYASSWYNGPWDFVEPEYVPLFVLRVPVRYYRQPPMYFRSWRGDAPPRWDDHWGNQWSQRHSGWDRWDRRAVPAPAPLPIYQRQYSGDQYPRAQQQEELRKRNYNYRPRDPVVRQADQPRRTQSNPVTTRPAMQSAPPDRNTDRRDIQRTDPTTAPRVSDVERTRPSQQRGGDAQRPAPNQVPQQRKHAEQPIEQRQQSEAKPHNKDSTRENQAVEKRDREQRRDKDEDRRRD